MQSGPLMLDDRLARSVQEATEALKGGLHSC